MKETATKTPPSNIIFLCRRLPTCRISSLSQCVRQAAAAIAHLFHLKKTARLEVRHPANYSKSQTQKKQQLTKQQPASQSAAIILFLTLLSVHTQETRWTAKTNTLSLSRSRSQTSSSVSPRCDMSHGAYAHNEENQQTREQNQKTLYLPGAINEQVFFLETLGQREPS